MHLSQLERENDKHLTAQLLLAITVAFPKGKMVLKGDVLNDRIKELEEPSPYHQEQFDRNQWERAPG